MVPFLFVSYIVWLYGPYRHFKLTLLMSKVTSGGTVQWRNMSLVKIELIDLILQFVHYPFIIDITLRISFSMFVIVSLTFFENIYIYICWKRIIWCNLFSEINYFLVKKAISSVLNMQIKLDGTSSRIKWKLHARFILPLKFWSYFSQQFMWYSSVLGWF